MPLRVIEFKTAYKPGGRAIDMVLVAPSGENMMNIQTWHVVSKIRPPAEMTPEQEKSLTYMDMRAKWDVIGPAYEAWKKGETAPENGTPLASWSGVTKAQAEVLRKMGLYTVEDVAEMGDGAVTRMPFPDARRLPKMAQEYLAGADAAALQLQLADKDARMAALEARLEEMIEEKPKPRRGRPPKQVEEAA